MTVAYRPFSGLGDDGLIQRCEGARQDMDFECYSYGVLELRRRRTEAVAGYLEVLTSEQHLAVVPWIERAAQAAGGFSSRTRGRCSLYCALLDLAAEGGDFALYVGQTGKSPARRFEQHKAGVKAGKGYVTRFGVQLLPSLTRHLGRMGRREAEDLEEQLATHFNQLAICEVFGGH